MEQKIQNILVVVLLVGIIGVSSLAVIQQLSYQNLDSQYQELLADYEILSSDWNKTSEDLNTLQSDFEAKQADYLTLIDDYASLSEIHLIVLSNNTSLQQSLDDLQGLYDQLLEDFDLLNASFVELEQNYADLQADYAQLQSDYDELQANYNQLLLDYDDLVTQYQALQDSYNALVLAYDILELQHNALVLDYNTLLGEYNTLAEDYSSLQNDYDALELSYNMLATWIRQQIWPAQYMVFAEAVRRYYFEDFYVQNKWAEGNISGYWTEFTRFCRDVTLHDSQIDPALEGSWFPVVSNALADCLVSGNQTEMLAFLNFMGPLWGDWSFLYPYHWGGHYLSGDALNDTSAIIDYCVYGISYEYDSDITKGQEPYAWDYIKFPVETAFRTKGDCEDQAILCAAYLESCGFETTIAVFHDDDGPPFGGSFYHGALLVQIEDPSEFWNRYPECSLWTLGSVDPEGRIWCWVDPTWYTPFGSEPSWLDWYKTNGISYEDVTFAICDLDGTVSYVPSGAGSAALEVYVP